MDSTNPPVPPEGVPAKANADYYPKDSLVGQTVRYCTCQIETATSFMVAGVLTLISIMLGREVYVAWGDQRIYPNLMQALIAPSGARKTQLISIITWFIVKLRPSALLADTTSHERLVECLVEQPIRALVCPEGKTLIDLINRSPELTTDFIKLSDCDPISTEFKSTSRKTADGKVTHRICAEAPFLTGMLAIVPDGLQINDKNQTNGYLGRLNMLMADHTERDILGPPPPMMEERERLLGEYRRLNSIKGEMRLSADALVLFADIQADNRRRLRAGPPEVIASNLTRMPFTVLKVAMLFQVAMDGGLEISREALLYARNYVELQHRDYCRFVKSYAADKKSRLCERIRTTLQRNGGRMTHSLLLNRVSTHGECNAKTFAAALNTLAELGAISFVENLGAKFPDVAVVRDAGGVPFTGTHSTYLAFT